MMKQRYSQLAFTLAELLIALAILGVIATFTIPKILDSGSSSKHDSIVKEVVAAVSEARQKYYLENGTVIDTGVNEYTPYLNYVRIETNTVVDTVNTGTSRNCDNVTPCLVMHSGAKINYHVASGVKFRTTNATAAIWYRVDPDGVYSGSTTGPSKATQIIMYVNGRVTSRGYIDPNTYISSTVLTPDPNLDPEYLAW